MSISCSIKFSPHSAPADQVNEIVKDCRDRIFKGCLTGYAVKQENGRTDWLMTYYSSDPKKEGIVYAVVTFKLNAQGHTLGFSVGMKTSAFSRWIICHLMNEIALRLNGILRAEGHGDHSPEPVSPSLSTFLKDTYGQLPQHMLTQQAGAFPPEFSLEDNWTHGKTSEGESAIPLTGVGGLEAGTDCQAADEAEPLVPGGVPERC